MAKQNDHFGGEVGVSFGKKLSVRNEGFCLEFFTDI
jgi:hypothetical protein